MYILALDGLWITDTRSFDYAFWGVQYQKRNHSFQENQIR
jgi:hypothetical protein